MGRTVLAYQFVASLLPEMKRKIAGIEGDFEQLLTQAQFEEVKLRELPAPQQSTPQSRPNMVLNRESPKGQLVWRDGAPRSQRQQERAAGAGRCFNCGTTGHIARNCRWRGLGSSEAQGRAQPPNKQGKIAMLVAREDQDRSRQMQQFTDDVGMALDRVMATMHGITPMEKQEDTPLGPIPTIFPVQL